MNPSEPQAVERLRACLDPAWAATLPLIEWLPEIDSTSSALLRRRSALPPRAALLADRQTAGRGRRGNPWSTPSGNLALSLFARLSMPPAALAGLSLALGVCCAEALHRLGASEVGLKWPNDLLARGRKLGGLLVELAASDIDSVDVVIGLGLNRELPADADRGWIGLCELATATDRCTLAARMIEALLLALQQFEPQGFAAFAARWHRLDALHGRPVRVLAAGVEHLGRAQGVGDDGALRVACAEGERVFLSADVSLRPA
jgi:BirA family biotin operon repressor/biotin-[acetyl-CoA-carboxylase] ligase